MHGGISQSCVTFHYNRRRLAAGWLALLRLLSSPAAASSTHAHTAVVCAVAPAALRLVRLRAVGAWERGSQRRR
eukprot:COSAG01_NODE_541_length_15735_cov_4.534088_15_plen_74_part_00